MNTVLAGETHYHYRSSDRDKDPREGTVKRSWDFYGKDGKKLPTHNKGYSVPRNNGKWESGFLTGRAISSDEWDGKIKTIKVPIGTWATVSDGNNCSDNLIDPGDKGILNVYWGIEDSKGASVSEQTASIDYSNTTLTDRSNLNIIANEHIATACANTKDLTNKPDNYKKDGEECYVSATAKKEGGTCVRSGLHLGSYCQLGENISSKICKDTCEGVKPAVNPEDDEYCIWAKERLCNKGINDKCIGTAKCGKYWVTDTETCGVLCGDHWNPNKKCTIGWMKYCSDPNVFKEEKEEEKICQGVLQKIQGNVDFSLTDIDTACKDDDNVFTGACKNLCTLEPIGKYPFDEWCNDKKKAFCSTGENLTTQDCLEFSKLNPDTMKETITGFCKNVTTIDHMNKEVLSKDLKTGKISTLNMSNWCGCMAPQEYYTAYEVNLKKELQVTDFELSGTGLLGNRACYGACNTKQAPIPTTGYPKDCPICIQTIINKIGKMDKTTIEQSQTGDCKGIIIDKKGSDVKPPVVPVAPGGDVNVNNWKYLLIMLIVLVIIFGIVSWYTQKNPYNLL